MRNNNDGEAKKIKFYYDINNEQHRERIKEFEQEFEKSGCVGTGAFYFWLRKLGIVKFKGMDWSTWRLPTEVVAYQNNAPVFSEETRQRWEKFEEMNLKWVALQDLRRARTAATVAQMSPEEGAQHEAKRKSMFDEVREKLRGFKDKVIKSVQPEPEPQVDDIPF